MLKKTAVEDHFSVLSGVETLSFVLIVERRKALAVLKSGPDDCAGIAASRDEEARAYAEHYSKMHARVKRIIARREEALHAAAAGGGHGRVGGQGVLGRVIYI